MQLDEAQEIGGAKAKDGVATHVVDVRADKVHFHAVHVVTMDSGDKISVPYQGVGTTKDGKQLGSKGTFIIGVGTGKLKGNKGKGTFTCTPAGDDLTCDVEGEYQAAQ